MNPSNRPLKASYLTDQRPEFLESHIRIFNSFDIIRFKFPSKNSNSIASGSTDFEFGRF